MRIHIGGDHAAYELQRALVAHLQRRRARRRRPRARRLRRPGRLPGRRAAAAEAVAADPASLGVVLGGSGNGEQIAANKVRGIRAALAWTAELAPLAREHNDAQVVSIGARMNTVEEAREICEVFLTTPFSGGRAPRPPAGHGGALRAATASCPRIPAGEG